MLRKIMFPVYQQCITNDLTPGLTRLKSHIASAIDDFFQTYGGVTAEQAEDPEERINLLANYYEGNWNGEIEAAAVRTITTEMRMQNVKTDKESSPRQIRRACGDELDAE